MRCYMLTVYENGGNGLGATYNLGRSFSHDTPKTQAICLLETWHATGEDTAWVYEGNGEYRREPDYAKAILSVVVED